MVKTFLGLIFFILPLLGLENYEVFSRQFQNDGTLFLITRRFEQNHQSFYLIVDTKTLQTHVATLPDSLLQSVDKEALKKTPFGRTLEVATHAWQQGGIDHATVSSPHALYLSMDLCPSSKPGYEKAFIDQLTDQNGKTPIAIAVSSAWIIHHEAAFEALRNNPHLDITWVNHTHTHFYDPHLEDRHNFMLAPHTDVQNEILGVEKTLLEKGITPSVFFRFPGLIADSTLMKALKETYFLIPIGADTWIAKHQSLHDNGFILIHGNKNEPLGIEMLEKMLPEVTHRYTLRPLREAFLED